MRALAVFLLAALTHAQTDVVHVTVLDPGGEPCAGARVTLVHDVHADAGLPWFEFHPAGDGRTVLDVAVGKNGTAATHVPIGVPHVLRVDHPPFARLERRHTYGGDSIVVRLEHGATIEGRVVLTDGTPAAGANVRTWRDDRTHRYATTTGEDGAFRFERLPPGRTSIRLNAPQGVLPPWTWLSLESGATEDVTITLERGTVVEGDIRDAATERPIPFAEVAIGWTFRKVVRADANGRYRIEGFGGTHNNLVFARADGYAPIGVAPTRTHAGHDTDIDLDPGYSLRGHVVDDRDRPVEGARVALTRTGITRVPNGSTPRFSTFTTTDAEGVFTFTGLTKRMHAWLAVQHEDHAYAFRAVYHPDRGNTATAKIALAPSRTMRGRVIDRVGAPRVGVTVSAQPRGFHIAVPRRLGVTDSEGRFTLRGLAAGEYTVRVEDSPFRQTVTVEPGVDPEPVRLEY